ncbi:hypothetical protein [Clostridium sp.]|uniref:hypothetical protein n=1 Tax=Clostridium sp. TaxID=1506 RepID=UPI0025BBEC31|nr:hypothetical protein [Clostridium sp.]
MKAIPREVKEEIREVVESELKKSSELSLMMIKDILERKYKRRFCNSRILEVLVEQATEEIVYVDLEEVI